MQELLTVEQNITDMVDTKIPLNKRIWAIQHDIHSDMYVNETLRYYDDEKKRIN